MSEYAGGTIPADWTQEEYPDQNTLADIHGMQATGHVVTPVHVLYDESERLSPEFCSCMTWSIPVFGATGVIPVQLLQRRYKRYKAKFVVNFTAAGFIVVNTKMEPLTLTSPQGFNVVATAAGNTPLPEYDAMQPMWAVASVAGVTISVWDESYGEVAT